MSGKTITRTARKWLWYAAEVCLFLPLDLAAVPLRNAARLRKLKARIPWLSCRRYPNYTRSIHCAPGDKYCHGRLFKSVVCRHYSVLSGECARPELQNRR